MKRREKIGMIQNFFDEDFSIGFSHCELKCDSWSLSGAPSAQACINREVDSRLHECGCSFSNQRRKFPFGIGAAPKSMKDCVIV